MDKVTIQSIHPDAGQMVVVFTIEGASYPKVLPFFSVSDANVLKTQLKAFSKELKGEFDALRQSVQGATPQVSADVQALEGQDIPVDDSMSTTPGTTDGSTPAGTPATPEDTATAATGTATASTDVNPGNTNPGGTPTA